MLKELQFKKMWQAGFMRLKGNMTTSRQGRALWWVGIDSEYIRRKTIPAKKRKKTKPNPKKQQIFNNMTAKLKCKTKSETQPQN